MRNMEWIDLTVDDIKELLTRGRKFVEFYGAFAVTDTQWKAKVPTVFPHCYKIDSKAKAIAEAKGEKYLGVLMTIAEYFNTKTSKSAYAQLRTADVVDGKDPNTYTYMTPAQLVKFVQLFGISKVKTHKEFEEEQRLETVETVEEIREETKT